MKKYFITTKEHCQVTGYSKQTIFRWVDSNKLTPVDKSAKKWLFEVAHIESVFGIKINPEDLI